MILNQADNIMLGNQEVQRVYLGKTLVWERKRSQYDHEKITVVLLDSQNNPTSTISYFEQYDNARNFIKNNTTNHYALYVGKEFAEKNNMASSTFSSLTNLISVYFSGSGASLFASNGHQFENCINLETVTIEGNSSILPQYCFNGCTSLKEIYIPDSIQELGAGCFQNCNDLYNFPFPENLSEIGSICFKASGLTTLNL
ncbi:MAG: leucine-rich repeat domain-containing protein, partial [Oscillospiraceae bacterium]|nr:leucine-rich repeat domain-containing protein [Oscillospiraceae bacterium]